MSDPKRFAVPMEQLDGVRVDAAQQVQEQDVAAHPDSGSWNGGQLVPAHGDGGGQVDDGE